jgi:hypothetical protein
MGHTRALIPDAGRRRLPPNPPCYRADPERWRAPGNRLGVRQMGQNRVSSGTGTLGGLSILFLAYPKV